MSLSLPATPRPAASLILLRDGPDGLEVLMMERSARASFGPGALVFPGGQVEAEDGPLDPPDACPAAFRQAAVREAWEETGTRVAPGTLIPFAHWITPPTTPKRFDTWFFLAALPPGPLPPPRPDGQEAVRALWMTMEAVMAEGPGGGKRLMLATYANLRRLAGLRTTAEARTLAETTPPPLVEPVVADGRITLPPDAGTEATVVAAASFLRA